jgi:hypothetical protein
MGAAEDGDELNAIRFLRRFTVFDAGRGPSGRHLARHLMGYVSVSTRGPDTGSQCAYRRATGRIKAYLVA